MRMVPDVVALLPRGQNGASRKRADSERSYSRTSELRTHIQTRVLFSLISQTQAVSEQYLL